MRRLRLVLSTGLLMGALALSACDHVVFYKGVTVGPPPPPLVGPVGVSPGPGWMWTDGFYDWRGNAWAWRPGRWARPPHPGYVWRRPTYERYDGGYRMHQGRWVRG